MYSTHMLFIKKKGNVERKVKERENHWNKMVTGEIDRKYGYFIPTSLYKFTFPSM